MWRIRQIFLLILHNIVVKKDERNRAIKQK